VPGCCARCRRPWPTSGREATAHARSGPVASGLLQEQARSGGGVDRGVRAGRLLGRHPFRGVSHPEPPAERGHPLAAVRDRVPDPVMTRSVAPTDAAATLPRPPDSIPANPAPRTNRRHLLLPSYASGCSPPTPGCLAHASAATRSSGPRRTSTCGAGSKPVRDTPTVTVAGPAPSMWLAAACSACPSAGPKGRCSRHLMAPMSPTGPPSRRAVPTRSTSRSLFFVQ